MPLTHLPNPKPLQVNADGSVVSGADTLALADKLALADTDTLALAGTDKLADTLSANNPHENDKKLI